MQSHIRAAKAAALARQFVLFLVLSCLLRHILDTVLARFHLPCVPALFSSRDMFADSLKSGMAEWSVSAPLLTDPKVLHWSPLFRLYLFHNDYSKTGILLYCDPPLGTLQLMGVAKVMVLSSPWAALAAEIVIYGVAAALFAWLLSRLQPLPAPTALLLTAPLCLSYPAFYMLDRGNFHSGYASICLAAYFCTAFTGRWRWLGIAALCYAINVRPNTAVVTMIELVLAPSLLAAIRVPMLTALLSGLVFVFSLAAAHHVDPAYSFRSFYKAYSLYRQSYIVNGSGQGWNDSLYGLVLEFRHLAAFAPDYSAAAFHAVTDLGILAMLGYIWLAVTGRIRPVECVFIAAAFCTLFTPVYGQYHILIFAAVLAVLGLNCTEAATPPRLGWVWPAFAALASVAWAIDLTPSATTALLLLFGPVIVVALLSVNGGDDMQAVVSLLVLSPLGGVHGNGSVIAALLTAALALLYGRAARRGIRMIPARSSRENAPGQSAANLLVPPAAGAKPMISNRSHDIKFRTATLPNHRPQLV